MNNAKEISRTVHCVHPHWSGYLRLFANGTSDGQWGTNSRGKWSFDETGEVLTILWDKYGREEFKNVGGEFIFSSICPHRPPLSQDHRKQITTEIEERIDAHPEKTSWLHETSMGPTLGIVIPYRAREDHLKKVIPQLISFFQRDIKNNYIKPLIVVSEQDDDLKFNRGYCCNSGFLAVKKYCDYICFHDVDYLPIWADYSYSAFPTQIIWHGINMRPVSVSSDNKLWVTIPKDNCLSAVVVIDKSQFLLANGYSNQYEGWGLEDSDLQFRLQLLGFPQKLREGTFTALDHEHGGFTPVPGEKTPEHLDNLARFERLKPEYEKSRTFPEGLDTIPVGRLNVDFELWSGLDKTESATICRLRISRCRQ